jgi:hypothetical protein
MSKGFTPEQLHATLQSSGTGGAPASGNWFTHLLPTIGGVVGGIGGGLLTAGLGGEVVGGAGGSALGKGLENALEGKKVIQGNDITAGLEGGIGNGVGGVVGKVIGKGASMLGSAGENIATKQAADKAAQEGIDTAANTYKDINPKLQGNLNAKDSLQHVTDMGYDVADPANLQHVSNTSNDVLNSILNKALADAGPVDLSHYPQLIKDALAKESGTLGSFDPVALARGRIGPSNTPAAKLLAQLEGAGNAPGEVTGSAIAKVNADPNEIRTLTTKLGQMAEDAKPMPTATTGAIDPAQRAAYNAINSVRNQVKDILYNRPAVNDTLTKLEGNILPDEATNVTPQLADHLNGIITGAGKNGTPAAQDLLSEISHNIDISKLGQEGEKVGQIVTSTGAKARAASEAGLDQPATGSDVNTAVANGGGLLAALHGHPLAALGAAAVHTAQNPAILSTLSRIGALGAKIAPAAGAVVGTLPNLAADPTGQTAPGGTMGGTMNNQPGTMTAGGTTDPNSMGAILSHLMAMGSVNPQLMGSLAPVISSLAPQVQKQSLLGTEMGALPTAYGNAGGAQGMGGIFSHLTGMIPGTAANTYEGQSNAVAHQLAATLGITPEAAAGLLPRLMQNGNSAGISQGILGNMQSQFSQ